MKLMGCAGQKIDRNLLHVHREMTDGLYGIGMEQSPVLPAQGRHRHQIEHSTDLVVGVHQRYQRFLVAGRQSRFQAGIVDPSAAIDRQQDHLHPVVFFHGLDGVQPAMVFHRRADDAPDAEVAHGAFDGHIVALGAARREKDLGRAGADTLRHGFARAFHQRPHAASFGVNARRVAEMPAHDRQHGVDHFFGDGGSGGIIKINADHMSVGVWECGSVGGHSISGDYSNSNNVFESRSV